MRVLRPLEQWLNRKASIPARFYQKAGQDIIDAGWGAGILLQECNPLHEADSIAWMGLNRARNETDEYLEKAAILIGGLGGGWLDRDEREMIERELGQPPLPCLPIYMVSIKKDTEEQLVYIGLTEGEKRFSNGHKVALSLHAPEFAGYTKHIYQCSIVLVQEKDEDYLSVEWLDPVLVASELIDSVESQLIFEFKPRFNHSKVNNYRATMPLCLHLQNSHSSTFMNDKHVYPPGNVNIKNPRFRIR